MMTTHINRNGQHPYTPPPSSLQKKHGSKSSSSSCKGPKNSQYCTPSSPVLQEQDINIMLPVKGAHKNPLEDAQAQDAVVVHAIELWSVPPQDCMPAQRKAQTNEFKNIIQANIWCKLKFAMSKEEDKLLQDSCMIYGNFYYLREGTLVEKQAKHRMKWPRV
jgi:hypothetical protein